MQITREFNKELNIKFAAKPLLIYKLKILQNELRPHFTDDQTHSEKIFVQFLFEKAGM